MLKKVTFISNTDILNANGGWDGLGFKIFKIISNEFDVELVDKISPKVSFIEKNVNRALKVLGLRSNFYFYSNRRLKTIQSICSINCNDNDNLLFFHGSTPWSLYKPNQKYFVLLDCSFVTYINVYHQRKSYSKKDLKRIEKLDENFINNAEAVFFTSHFALNQTKECYSLNKNNLIYIGQGPSIQIKNIEFDLIKKKKQFLFIASDFEGKGGDVIYRSFCKFSKFHPEFKLVLVGQKPPSQVLKNRNIQFLGYIDKSEQIGLNLLNQIYQESSFLILLSDKDIAPLVVIEAGLNFCPSLAYDTSAVKELINDGESGFLLNNKDENTLFKKLISLAKISDYDYYNLCVNAHKFMEENNNWDMPRKVLNSFIKKY
jgi:glycosyltransferase involved in cell wall biosynthesis